MSHDDELSRLIEASSLGTPAARRLRQRTLPGQAAVTNEIAALRDELASGGRGRLLDLGLKLEAIGDTTGAEECYREAATAAMTAMAALYENQGHHAAAAQWRARAGTLTSGPAAAGARTADAAHGVADGPARQARPRPVTGAKFEIYEDKSGGFRFRLKAPNGEVVATGESYTTRSSAHDGCEAAKRAAAAATIEDA